VYIPPLTYSSGTWAMIKKKEQDTETIKVKFHSSLAGHTLEDQIRNTVIGNEFSSSNYRA
jgi:hypothetical protein